MGIEAFCPNGHRIKVKDEYAGRLGVCPTCGSRFRLPDLPAQPAAAPLPTARLISLDPTMIQTLPVATAYGQPAAAAQPVAATQPIAVTQPSIGGPPFGSVPLGSVPLGSVPLGSVTPAASLQAGHPQLPQQAAQHPVGPAPVGIGPGGFPPGMGPIPQQPMQVGEPGQQEAPVNWAPTVRGRKTYPRQQGGSGAVLALVLLIAVAAAAAMAWQILRSRGIIP